MSIADKLLQQHYRMAKRLYVWANFQYDKPGAYFAEDKGENRPRNPLVSEEQGQRIIAMVERYKRRWQARVYELWAQQNGENKNA